MYICVYIYVCTYMYIYIQCLQVFKEYDSHYKIYTMVFEISKFLDDDDYVKELEVRLGCRIFILREISNKSKQSV